MPQAVPLPDGSYVSIREGETPQQAYARAQQMYPEAFAQKQAPAPTETTFGGQTKEFFKGLVPGAIGLTEQAGIGISALLPEEQEKATQKYIKEVAATAKAPFAAAPGYEDTVGRKFGEATGSFLPFVATGPFGLAGRVAGYGLGIGAGAGTQVEKSAAEGATEGQQTAATALGAVVGASEMFAPTRILKRLGEPVLEGATAYVKRALMAGGEEAAQEAAAQAAQNIITKGIYKPEQEIIEQVGESAAYGGAVGGLAQGLLDLAIGRRAPKPVLTDEIKQAREEAAAQAEQEKARLNSPEYAQGLFQQTQALEAQRRALKEQLIPIRKGESPETDYANNREINRQIEAINKELKPLADEYVRVKPILKQAAEQERLAQMSPEDFMLEQQGLKVEPINRPAPKQIINEFGQIVDEEAPTPAPDPVKDYAVGQVQSAQNVGQLGLDDYADYLMQDPKMAAQVLQQRPALPGLNKNDQGLVFSGVKFRLQAQEKQAQAAANAIFKQEMGTRQTAFGATKPEEESQYVQAFTSYMDDIKSQRDDVGDDMFFKYMVEPKLEKISEGKPPVIAVNPQLMPFAQPKQAAFARTKINTLLDQVEVSNEERDAALRSNNQDAATAAFERGNQALEQLNSLAAETPAGELTKGRFPSAKTGPEASIYAKEVLRVRNEQNTALNTIEDKLDRLRRGDALGKENAEPGKGMAAAAPNILAKQAEEARGQYISAVLEEAAIHRRVAGKPALTYDEAIKAASRIHDVVGEWLSRARAVPKKPELEEVIVQPAQMRANKLIRGAVTKRVLKTRDLATTPLNDLARLSDKEVKHFKAQIAKVVDGLSEMPSQVSRETPVLKQQFATTEAQKVAEARGETAKTAGGEMRRLREYVGNMIDKALTRNIPEGAVEETEDGPIRTQGIRETLERVKEIIEDGKASKNLLDAAQNQAERILRGEDLGKQTYTRREAVPGKRVVENVPGREAETRFGERRTYKSVGYEAALAPEGSALRELQDAIKLYERTAQEGEIAGEGAAGQGQLFPETRKDIGYIRATPANFAKSPQIKPVWEALDQARKLKAKTEANQKARSARDKQGFAQIEALEENIESIKNQMQFFLTKPGDFNIGKYSDADIAKMFASYPEAGVTKEDKKLMDRYLQVSKQSIGKTKEQKEQAMSVFTEEEKAQVDKLIKGFNSEKIPEYARNVKQALQTLALGQRLEGANNRLVELMQDNNAAVRKQSEALNKITEPLMEKLKLIKASLRNSVMLTEGQRAMIDSEVSLQTQRNAYQKAMATAMGKARQRLSDTLGELLDPEIERARRSLKAAKTRLATVESQIEAAKKEMTEGTGQAPNLINNLQKVQGFVESIEKAETELDELQKLRFGEIENDVVVTEAMLDKDLKTEREYLEILERQLADMRKEPLTAVELGERGKLGKLKYPFSAQRVESQVKAQQAAVDEAEKRANEFQKDVQVWWPKVTAAFKKDGISVKDLPGAVFEKGRKVAEINTPEQKRLDELRDKGMQAAKEVDEAAVRQRVKDKQIELFDDEIFDARGEVQGLMGPEDMNQLADIMADPETTNTKRAQATLKLGAMQKLFSLEAQKEAFLTGKPAKAPKAATVPSTTALAAGKPFRTGSGAGKAFTPEEMDEMNRAELRDANALAKQILGTTAPQLKEPSKRKQGKMPDPNMGLFDDFEFSRGKPSTGLTKAELIKELDKAIGEKGLFEYTREDPYGNKETKVVTIYENLNEYLGTLEPATRNFNKGQIPSDAKGFVQDGKAVLFANNIAKGEGLGVLLHEVGVHIGFRNFFNAGQYNALVKTVKNWANKTDDSMEARVGKAAMRRVEAAETPANQIDDELLAYAVEETMQMGVSPAGVKGGSALKNWLKMVVDGFKKALEKFGISAKNLTAGDLVNFAYGAANLELRGTWHGSDAKFTAFDTKYVGKGEGAYDRRFDGDNSLGAGPYVTPYKEYGEYYQQAVPFGKASNESGYGRYSYQDYAEALANETYKADTDRSTVEIQRVFESNLMHRYLNSVLNGGNLDPTKNRAAASYILELKKHADMLKTDAESTLASRQKRKVNADRIEEAEKGLAYALRFDKAVNTLDVSKIKGLTERPTKGNLYRTLDDIPRENVFSVNSEATVGERPKIDALLKKYGPSYELRNFEQDGKYNMNSLYYSMRDKLGVEKTNELLKDAGMEAIEQRNDRKYIERAYLDKVPEILGTNLEPVGQLQTGEMLFSRKAAYTNPEIAKHSGFVDKIVAKDKGWTQKLKANLTGLAFETQLVDRFAGFERLAKYMEPLKGTQMLYYLRMYDQRMNFVSQAVSNGAPAIVEKTRPDGRVERVLESKESANIHNVVQILKDAQPMVGNAEAVNTMFTLYMAAIRADNKGLASLNFGEDVTQKLLNDTMSAIKATPGLETVFKNAKAEYNDYNRNLIDFVVSTGALSKEVGKRLSSENDYIPFYRERNGVAELLIGGESPIRIGSIAEQPYLHELVGGDRPILDFMTSSVQNTNLLMDMGMRNLATKNAVHELVDLKAAKFVKMSAGPDVVKFRVDGEDRYAVIATEKVKIGNKEFDTGVPADILVKGMEGIPTQMPAMLRVMAMPAQLLRKAITLSPLYTAKQLFRDSLAAPILSGADFMPVIGALKEINSATKKTLESRGVTGGQQFVGGAEDLTKILRDVSEGKSGWMTALGKLEAMSMEADATTRRAQYNSYIEQGLSEMEATLLALESMNFNKRGASPSVHVANSLIPFFNAQIQGLNVLYKASMGKMPFNDQLRIREKMLRRGAFMAVASLAYAALMQDDEAYKNANPDQKYGNWFVRVPGLDEPIKVPVPFEIGYIFKALPEAILNSMVNENGGEEAVKAFKQILLQTIPGGSSYGIPQIMKPAIEAGLGKSFYTGRDILSAREKELLPEEQFRANTTELAKGIGNALGISPIVFEQLVSGYTGTMGLAFMQALSVGIPTGETPEKAVKRLSEYPILGGAFQPNDAGGIVNSVYERMNENLKVKQSFDKMVAEGRMSDAKALLQRRGNEYMQAELANSFKNDMNQLTQAERAIAASKMPPEEKRAQLDKIRKIKTAVAQTVRDISDKTILLASPF